MNEKKSLLEKYAISIEHLDFDYIKSCQNVRKLEKMIEILKSGEEGYYPDLTNFAEEKLRELDPDNRMLRTELKCLSTSKSEVQEINEFVRNIKTKDRKMRVEVSLEDNSDDMLPPVRSTIKPVENADTLDTLKSIKTKSKRIASSDYKKWDKYDADTECLKMDLHEEQIREKSLAEQKRQHTQKPKLIEILSEETTHENMSDVERHEIADKHRIKGNEFFKCSEYQEAISEYTKSLAYVKTASVYNNRAIAHLKNKMYSEAIRDCDACLKLDTTNVKAMLRKCDALVESDRKNEAFKVYSEIMKIDPENVIAKKALKNISIRLEIQEVNIHPQNKQVSDVRIKANDEDDYDDDE